MLFRSGVTGGRSDPRKLSETIISFSVTDNGVTGGRSDPRTLSETINISVRSNTQPILTVLNSGGTPSLTVTDSAPNVPLLDPVSNIQPSQSVTRVVDPVLQNQPVVLGVNSPASAGATGQLTSPQQASSALNSDVNSQSNVAPTTPADLNALPAPAIGAGTPGTNAVKIGRAHV